ncbi:hypothetical protein AB3R30_21690 [Leptolyngbyaceae cyanobacterium UHCC 1019]
MNKQTIELLQLVVLCLSIGSACFAAISWYSASVQKKYASQRDFEHLKRNYQQLSEGQATILKEFDTRFDKATLDAIESKNLLNVILIKLSNDASTGWTRKP